MTHALRVAEDGAAFRSLFAAIRERGERAGWLELGAPPRAGGAIDGTVDDGAWKVVAVEPDRSVAVKTRRGPAVLRDLMREHFGGCRLVLVRGDAELPALRPRDDGWEVVGLDGEVRRFTTAELLRALRSPHLRS